MLIRDNNTLIAIFVAILLQYLLPWGINVIPLILLTIFIKSSYHPVIVKPSKRSAFQNSSSKKTEWKVLSDMQFERFQNLCRYVSSNFSGNVRSTASSVVTVVLIFFILTPVGCMTLLDEEDFNVATYSSILDDPTILFPTAYFVMLTIANLAILYFVLFPAITHVAQLPISLRRPNFILSSVTDILKNLNKQNGENDFTANVQAEIETASPHEVRDLRVLLRPNAKIEHLLSATFSISINKIESKGVFPYVYFVAVFKNPIASRKNIDRLKRRIDTILQNVAPRFGVKISTQKADIGEITIVVITLTEGFYKTETIDIENLCCAVVALIPVFEKYDYIFDPNSAYD